MNCGIVGLDVTAAVLYDCCILFPMHKAISHCTRPHTNLSQVSCCAHKDTRTHTHTYTLNPV